MLQNYLKRKMLPIKVKARLKKGKLKAKVSCPLIGKAELEVGPTNKLKAIIKVPFIVSAKFLGILKLKKRKKNAT